MNVDTITLRVQALVAAVTALDDLYVERVLEEVTDGREYDDDEAQAAQTVYMEFDRMLEAAIEEGIAAGVY